MTRITDEMLEIAAEKLLAGTPLTRAELAALNSANGHFVMAQVEAIQRVRKSKKRAHITSEQKA